MKKTEPRHNDLKKRLEAGSHQSEFEELPKRIDIINLERARISFATASLAMVEQARTSLLNQIRSLQ